MLLSVLVFPTAAEGAEDEQGIWAIVSANDPIRVDGQATAWRFAFDAQYRFVDDQAGFSQYVLRPSVGYTFNSGMQLWIGYGRFDTELSGGPGNFENRYWQQVNGNLAALAGGMLSGRLRMEQRMLSTGDDVAVVVRLMLRYARPLGDREGQYWVLGCEPFVDLRDTDWGAEQGVSQNRLTLGVGRSIGERLSVELGYMNQYFFRDTRTDRSNHLATVNFRLRF